MTSGLCKRKRGTFAFNHKATMKRFSLALVAALLWCAGAAAQEQVHFPSLEDNGPGPGTVAQEHPARSDISF